MSQAVADAVRDLEIVVVVNDAFRLAPWATALAAQDHGWWRVNKDAHAFAGRKFSSNRIDGTEQIDSQFVTTGSSSGVLALEVAWKLGATDIELHGYENHQRNGFHYFGAHPAPLRTTPPSRFKVFEQQLSDLGRAMKKEGIRIVNKTPDSDLRCFERG
jgi:hypothetical protein